MVIGLKKRCLYLCLLLWLGPAQGKTANSTDLSELLNRVTPQVLAEFHTPGVTIAVFDQHQILFHQGYGFRDAERQLPVTTDTYFRIASTTKAITAASIAILVKNGRLDWNDRVTDYLPDFRMATDHLTAQMRIIDLLSHNSGLRGGAGDSMLWPEPASFTPQEIVHNLRYLTPQSDFRSGFSYSNALYITAAEVVKAVSKMPWADFVDTNIFQPLQMHCFAGDVPVTALDAAALPYGYSEERGIFLIPRNAVLPQAVHSVAAGGVVCNSEGMVKWLQHLLQIYLGQEHLTGDQATVNGVISITQLNQLWRARTVMPVTDFEQEWHNTALKSYALGWRLSQFGEHKMLSHTGTLSGYQAQVALLPDNGIGIVILNNGSNYAVRNSLLYTILHHLLAPQSQRDWKQVYSDHLQQRLQDYLTNYTAPHGNGIMTHNEEHYIGDYVDKWFGKMAVSKVDQQLRINSERMPMLSGNLEPFEENTWVIRWDNENAASVVFIHFTENAAGEIRQFSISPYRVTPPESHEWQDMSFIKSAN